MSISMPSTASDDKQQSTTSCDSNLSPSALLEGGGPMILRASNWDEFQHYRDRNPPWIKLHRDLLNDFAWHRLSDASRALMPMLWLLASETVDGVIMMTLDEIAFRLRRTAEEIKNALIPLIGAGFFALEHNASNTLAKPERDATSESERELDKELEEEAFAAFLEDASKHGWPVPHKLTDSRRYGLKALISEHGIAGWKAALAKAAASSFFHEKFPLKLDWLLKAENFVKTVEGNYDARPSNGSATIASNSLLDAPAKLSGPDGPWRAWLPHHKPGAKWDRVKYGPPPESDEDNPAIPDSARREWREYRGLNPRWSGAKN